MHHPLVNIAIKAALKAGDVIHRAFERFDLVKIEKKSTRDYVTDIDRKSEQEIIYIIRQAYPDHGIIAEESGTQGDDEVVWIIDPLDGTNNFVHQVPHFSISIAVQQKGRIEHGVIYDPIRRELFTASRGKGATLNDRRMRVSDQTTLDTAFVATGFPFRHEDSLSLSMMQFNSMMQACKDVRRFGSAALDLAYVAAGRFDAYYELNLSLWDIAAGQLMVKEAGGMVTDTEGQENYLTSGNILATNTQLIKKLLPVLNP